MIRPRGNPAGDTETGAGGLRQDRTAEDATPDSVAADGTLPLDDGAPQHDHAHAVDQLETRSGEWHSLVDRFAVASLVCSLLGFVTGLGALFGIVFGLIARARIKQSESLSGRRLAMGGIVIGIVALATTAAFVTILVSHLSGPGAPPGSDAVLSGSPKNDVELAKQELVPPSDLPSNWTGGDGSTQFAHETFFGSGNLQASMVAPLARCVGVVPATIDLHPAEAADQMYGPDANNVDFNDTVDVYPTKADALVDITAATNPRVDTCLLQLVVLPGLPGYEQDNRSRTFFPPHRDPASDR